MMLFLQFMDILTSYFRPIKTFPMAYFPQLAQIEILEQMDPLDLFNFSLLSSKNRETVMKLKKWKQFKIEVIVSNRTIVFFMYTGHDNRFDININANTARTWWWSWTKKEENVRGHKVRIEQTETVLTTWWNNVELGMRTIGNHLIEMFNNPNVSLYINYNDIQLIDSAVQWLLERNHVNLDFFVVSQNTASPDQIYYIMEKFTVSKRLDINVEIDFDRIQHRLPTNLDMFHCQGILRLDHALIMNPKILYLYNTPISSEVLNQYLRLWKGGGAFSRLKHFRVLNTGPLNDEDVMRDIEHERYPDDEIREYRLFKHWMFKFGGGKEVINENGVLATVHYDAQNYFSMLVWPDLGENFIEYFF